MTEKTIEKTIDASKTPYIELIVAGEQLAGRTLACSLDGSLAAPRALGWIELDDRDGVASAAAVKDAAIEIIGGRRGLEEITLLTGTIPRDPSRGEGAQKHILRVPLADGWAAADKILAIQTLMDVTPQEVLQRLLALAGIAKKRLTMQAFQPKHQVVLDGVSLAGAAQYVKKIWELEDWVVGFDPDGLFFWEPWSEHPAAGEKPEILGEDELLKLKTDDGGGGRAETFFHAPLFPGGLVELMGEEKRIEQRRHYFDGNRFRTEIRYGPVPA